MEFAKNKIDQLNAWHSRTDDLQVDEFTRTTDSVHFYDSIVVFERKRRTEPEHRVTGQATFREFPDRLRLANDGGPRMDARTGVTGLR
jgi:hypothetical protein